MKTKPITPPNPDAAPAPPPPPPPKVTPLHAQELRRLHQQVAELTGTCETLLHHWAFSRLTNKQLKGRLVEQRLGTERFITQQEKRFADQQTLLSDLRQQLLDVKTTLGWYAGSLRPEDRLADNGERAQQMLTQLEKQLSKLRPVIPAPATTATVCE
jgi:hypothetical protein